MKRVLLTGAGGFVGRRCVPALVARGYEVHAVGRRRHGAHEDSPREDSPRCLWHEADLLDAAGTDALVARVEPTHLLHLAWYAEHGKFWSATQNLRWIGASLALFEPFAARGGRRIVAAGTCAEYSWEPGGVCREGATPLAPATLYGACKHATHVVLEALARQSGVSHAWGRVFFPYGPHEHPDRLLAYAVRSLLERAPVACTPGDQARDFIFVEDAAEALVALLDSPVEGAVNIGSGAATTVREMLTKAADQIGGRDLLRFGALPRRAGEPALLVADASRLRDEVGWRPRRSLDEGIGETIEWWRARLGDPAGRGR
ncbi:MAG: NAD(P)-dependent oxidoreductase [Acidobacteria bacterium]|nr:NAD(P)-dependent oxidoreductase [Acidobacteriota bacterium]